MSLRAASPSLVAALIFGASTPLAKVLVGNMPPLLLAGLLHLGSGLGPGAVLGWRRWRRPAAAAPIRIPPRDLPWPPGAIAFGGVLGPALPMWGLGRTGGATAPLLLNVEGGLRASIAWVAFKVNANLRIILGMVAIVAGGALLSWEPAGATLSSGALLIVGACLAWAIDNNLTHKVAANDAMLVACLKGLLAGARNTALAVAFGASLPAAAAVAANLLVGFPGCGLSLSLFVVGPRTLGTARTGAYFSSAPFIGAAVALLLLGESTSPAFWLAANARHPMPSSQKRVGIK